MDSRKGGLNIGILLYLFQEIAYKVLKHTIKKTYISFVQMGRTVSAHLKGM